jgi:hypothetical protein
MMSREPKTASLGIRVPERLKKNLEAWADADHRSVASLVEKILADAVSDRRKKGTAA